jgi:autonomous glycyl radical cofactor GrcA
MNEDADDSPEQKLNSTIKRKQMKIRFNSLLRERDLSVLETPKSMTRSENILTQLWKMVLT